MYTVPYNQITVHVHDGYFPNYRESKNCFDPIDLSNSVQIRKIVHSKNCSSCYYNKIEFFTYAKISPSEVQIPRFDHDGDENCENCINHSKAPPTFFDMVLRQPKANDFHVEGHDGD